MKINRFKYIIFAIFFILSGLIYSFFRFEKDDDETIISSDEKISIENEAQKIEEIFVYICGNIKQPGVYGFESGERINDAIEKAGGVTKEANLSNLNLAEILKDGQMIYIKSIHENSEEESDGLININTASEEMLMSLPGIGNVKAQGIISYRENSGLFNSIEDIMKVEGIKEALFSKIKDFIKV